MAAPAPGNGLARWLLGGLIVGGIVLGLLVAAYEIGYHRGHGKARTVARAQSTSTTTATTTASASGGGSADRGKQLFTADGCASCHSLDGSKSVGPTMKGLAGSSVQLADGSSVTADDAYLEKAIASPDAEIVKGYPKGTMTGAIASFGLSGKPQDVAALVAFIKTQR